MVAAIQVRLASHGVVARALASRPLDYRCATPRSLHSLACQPTSNRTGRPCADVEGIRRHGTLPSAESALERARTLPPTPPQPPMGANGQGKKYSTRSKASGASQSHSAESPQTDKHNAVIGRRAWF